MSIGITRFHIGVFLVILSICCCLTCSSPITPTGPASTADDLQTKNPAKMIPANFGLKVCGNQVEVALPVLCDVTVEIRSAAGDLVRSQSFIAAEAGWLAVTWDGLSDNGKKAKSGIYVVCASAGSWHQCMPTYWYDGKFNSYQQK